jgi:transposase-like protein
MNSPGSRPLIGSDLERCIYCDSTHITKAGKRYKQYEILQCWDCHACGVSFSPRWAGKSSTYPLKVILEALCQFYQGNWTNNTEGEYCQSITNVIVRYILR